MNIFTAGLAFGDEGKGSWTDFLVRESHAKMVVRYNGGPQAAHNVVTDDGRHHEFHQFGSGTFAGAKTYLSRFMLIEPYSLMNERNALLPKLDFVDPLERLYVEAGCPVITPFHWITNRIRETARGAGKHGSCGMGVGELRQDQTSGKPIITAGCIIGNHGRDVGRALEEIRAFKIAEVEAIGVDPSPLLSESISNAVAFYQRVFDRINVVKDDLLRLLEGPFVFEGAQGMLLDQYFGSAPHNTWTDCTFANAKILLGDKPVTKIGILRSYYTRHGAGPFPTECPEIDWPDHNKHNQWQSHFRQGRFDIAAAKYALESIGGVDVIAISHMDRTEGGLIECVSRRNSVFDVDPQSHATAKLDLADLSAELSAKIGMLSYGHTASGKRRA